LISWVRGRKGFSLIEILVAMVLLAVGILAIAGMQVASVRGNFSSNNISQAVSVAQDRLEILKNLDIGDAALSIGLHNEAVPSTIFSREWNVSAIPGTTAKSITMTVRWRDPSDHSISFSTVKSE
jgi:type IV pilus assembly protein PilV